MRYEKFLLEDQDDFKVNTEAHIKEGEFGCRHHNISEVEACRNEESVRKMEVAFHLIAELFELPTLELSTTYRYFALSLIESESLNYQKGKESPRLCQSKMRLADPKEIAEAVIDLVLKRDQWKDIQYTVLTNPIGKTPDI